MNDRIFIQHQVSQLQRLLDDAGDDPILVPQLKQRLEDFENELKSAEGKERTLFPMGIDLPRVALFLSGGGSMDSDGIRPALAGETLIQYERMFTEQALHDERAEARAAGRFRRRRGAPIPSLLFTGTPKGSFGFEFVPQQSDDGELLPVHTKALKNVADALVQVSDIDPATEKVIEGISPRVLQPMKKFLKTLAQHDAALRLAFSDAPSLTIDAERIKRASERLEREWEEEEITETGTFRGLTRETTIFDLVTDDGRLITGTIADSLTEEDFDRIDALTNKHCQATLQRTTLRTLSGPLREMYLLLDAKPEEQNALLSHR